MQGVRVLEVAQFTVGGSQLDPDRHPLIEHPNRASAASASTSRHPTVSRSCTKSPIAGGISAALFHRERTGEATEVDVSLLSTAWWAAGASVTQAMKTGETMRSLLPDSTGPSVNSSSATTRPPTADQNPVHREPHRLHP